MCIVESFFVVITMMNAMKIQTYSRSILFPNTTKWFSINLC